MNKVIYAIQPTFRFPAKVSFLLHSKIAEKVLDFVHKDSEAWVFDFVHRGGNNALSGSSQPGLDVCFCAQGQ